MKFSCEKSVLNDAISTCIHAVASKSSIQVLEGLLIVAEGDVKMTGYNFKTGIKTSFPASVFQSGSVVLNARILSDIVRKLPDDIVEISVDDTMNATIRCISSEFNIPAYSAGEYPELPEVERDRSISVKNTVLKGMIGDTIYAISSNENKPIHTGSLFELTENQLTLVSVDGFRMSIRKEEVVNHSETNFKFVVPGDTLREISRILPDDEEPTKIYSERRHALFETDGILIVTRLLEGEFLNYRAALPQDSTIHVEVDCPALIEAVERVSLIISERLKNPICCRIDGSHLKLSCATALGRASDEIKIPDCGKELEIGFNNRFLLDALRACHGDTCVLNMKSSLSPCILTPVEGDSYLYMILPVRLKAGE